MPMKNKMKNKIMYRAVVLSIIFLLITPLKINARHDYPERYYQEKWCQAVGGQAEVILPDRTRCDCLTETHAIEFDFGSNWAEAIGQSLYYSLQTGRRAGIVLIIETPEERRFWIRLNTTINHFNLPIDAWSMGEGAY